MRRISLFFALIVSIWFPTKSFSQTTEPTTQPSPLAQRIIVISVDGLRPDLALRANMPNLRKMMSEGSYTFWARTVPVAITLPSHISMLTGVSPEKHGVDWNHDLPLTERIYPKYPTLLEIAHMQGRTTAVAAGKAKFSILAKPGVLDWSFLPAGDTCPDGEVDAAAEKIIREHQPQVMFIHFGAVDGAGHGKGWGSPEQIKRIEDVDKYLGQILAVIDEMKLLPTTAIIVTADHGGQGRGHGAGDARSLHIPWVIVGPGIKHDFDLALYGSRNIDTVDTFATACWLVGLPMRSDIDGHPVLEVANSPVELLHAK